MEGHGRAVVEPFPPEEGERLLQPAFGGLVVAARECLLADVAHRPGGPGRVRELLTPGERLLVVRPRPGELALFVRDPAEQGERVGHRQGIAVLPRERQTPLAQFLGAGVIALVSRDPARRAHDGRAQRQGGGLADGERAVEPRPPLGRPAPHRPIGLQRDRQPEERGRIVAFGRPGQRRPEVVQVGIQAGDGIDDIRPPFQEGGDRLGAVDEVVGVPLPHHLGLAARLESIVGELADGLQHEVAGLIGRPWRSLQQALVDERRDAVEDGDGKAEGGRRAIVVYSSSVCPSARDGFGCLQGEAAGEDGQPAEEGLFVGGEQVVAPGDRVAHGALPRGQVAGAAGQQAQPVGQARQEGGRGEGPHPGGGELDGQRQPVEAADDLGHRRRVLGASGRRPDRPPAPAGRRARSPPGWTSSSRSSGRVASGSASGRTG